MAYAAATFADVTSFDSRSSSLGSACRVLLRGLAIGLGGLTAIGLTVAVVMAGAAWIIGVCLAAHPDFQGRTSILAARTPALQASAPIFQTPVSQNKRFIVEASASPMPLEAPDANSGAPLPERAEPVIEAKAPLLPKPVGVIEQSRQKSASADPSRSTRLLTRTADARDFTLDAEAAFVSPLGFAAVPALPPAPVLAAPPLSVRASPSPRLPHPQPRTAERAENRPAARVPSPAKLAPKHEAAAPVPQASAPEVTASLPQGREDPNLAPAVTPRTAIYDIEAHTVYLPNGQRLEAHSGLGRMLDDPRFVQAKARGATPPNVYQLSLRQGLFHGVRAIRLNPVNGSRMFGRDGILAHTYMLGPSGQSFGCVSFRNYPQFLQAFLNGEVDRIVVVPHLDSAPAGPARARRGRSNGYSFNDRRRPDQPDAPSTAMALISMSASGRSNPATRTPVAAG